MTSDNFCFYLQNRLIQTSKTGGQWYSDTSPFSILCYGLYCCNVSDELKSFITLATDRELVRKCGRNCAADDDLHLQPQLSDAHHRSYRRQNPDFRPPETGVHRVVVGRRGRRPRVEE